MNRRTRLRLLCWIVFCGVLFFVFGQPGEWLAMITDCIAAPPHGTKVSGDSLQATVITPYLEDGIAPGKNLLWCGTFQLAWNECIQLTGGPLRFEQGLPLATQMNRQEFNRKWVDRANTIAIAGFVRDDVYGQIERALRAIASDADYGRYKPNRSFAVRQQDIVAYSYLQTNIKFPSPFEGLGNQLKFLDTPVLAFGIGPEAKPGYEQLFPQVWVHEYNSQSDFVVELASTTKGDRLILARVIPGETLVATIQAVEERLVTPPTAGNWTSLTEDQRETAAGHLGRYGDVLMVPKIAFDLTKHYDELAGHYLIPAKPGIATDLQVTYAVQSIFFEMDERGVRLRSASHISFGCEDVALPRTTRRMIFDGPFLLMLQREGAPLPYFAAWIGNTELLQR